MCPITVEQPQNGKLEVFKGTKPFGQRADKVEAGSQVTMKLTPNAGYKIDHWVVNGKPVEKTPGSDFVNNRKTITISEPTTISAVL